MSDQQKQSGRIAVEVSVGGLKHSGELDPRSALVYYVKKGRKCILSLHSGRVDACIEKGER